MSEKNISFILHKPQLSENIGACARAIKNFRFNVSIAHFYEMYSFFKDNFNYKTKKVSYDQYIKEAYPS